jgi:hypothetical protein
MGPIAVELVAQPPASEVQSQALIASCSGAAGPAGCELAGQEHPPESSIRAIVSFGDGYASVRVEAVLPFTRPDGRIASRTAAREAVFREGDPVLERFRAVGLIVAGLVADLAPESVTGHVALAPRPSAPPSDAPQVVPPVSDREPVGPSSSVVQVARPAAAESRPPVPRPRRWPVALSLAGIATPFSDRPRLGAAFDGDFPLPVPSLFVTTHASYGQTVEPDATGISILEGTLGVGAGVALRIPFSAIWMRSRACIELEGLRVAIDQPGTSRRDAASVLLPGVGGDVQLVWAVFPVAGIFAGARLDWTRDDVSISVAGKPTELLSSWSAAIAFGATVWLQ